MQVIDWRHFQPTNSDLENLSRDLSGMVHMRVLLKWLGRAAILVDDFFDALQTMLYAGFYFRVDAARRCTHMAREPVPFGACPVCFWRT